MKKLLLIITLLLLITSAPSYAKKSESIMLDSETISWLKDLAKPLLKTAGIDPKSVNFYIIKSDEINAFVTPNKDIFFYSGLILKAETAEEVQGVLAHEIGHIKGKHYIKSLVQSEKRSIPLVIGTLLGAGAAALGSGEAAMALISGGLATAQDQILRHSRSHERQADTIAASLLNQNNWSADGLISFFNKLRTSNLLYSKTPPAWLVTHPLPRQRISAMQEHINNENIERKAKPLNADRFKRVQAKLVAFTKSHGFTQRKYAYKNSEDAIYARAISAALKGKTNEAIALIKQMSPDKESLPFHYEILAQLYQDQSEYVKADNAFSTALKINHDLEFIRLQMAENLIILEKYNDAIKNLHIVSHIHPTWSGVFKSLGIAHGKKGELFDSHIYLAKEASIRKKVADIKIHLQLAEKYMDKDNKHQQTRLKTSKEILKDLNDA